MDKHQQRTLQDIEQQAPGLLAGALYVEQSGAFKSYMEDDGTLVSTTYIGRTSPTGLTETTLEAELDLATHWPEEIRDHMHSGFTGGYDAFVTAQMQGPKAAHDYALRTGENATYFGRHAQPHAPDQQAKERQIIRSRIHALCAQRTSPGLTGRRNAT